MAGWVPAGGMGVGRTRVSVLGRINLDTAVGLGQPMSHHGTSRLSHEESIPHLTLQQPVLHQHTFSQEQMSNLSKSSKATSGKIFSCEHSFSWTFLLFCYLSSLQIRAWWLLLFYYFGILFLSSLQIRQHGGQSRRKQ